MASKNKQIANVIDRQENSSKRLNEHAALLNYEYGEMAAEEAYRRQQEFYNIQKQDTSYEAQVADVEKAGLSYGILGGGMAAGGGGGGTPAMGGGAGSQKGKGADVAAAKAAQAQEELTQVEKARGIAETGLLSAETIKTEAETRGINSDIKSSEAKLPGELGMQEAAMNLTYSKIDELTQEIENSKIQKLGFELQNDFDKIRNEKEEKTKIAQINKIEAEWEILEEQLSEAVRNNEIGEETKQAVINSVHQGVANMAAEEIYTHLKSDLTKEQKKEISEKINNDFQRLLLERSEHRLDERKLEWEIDKIIKQHKHEINMQEQEAIKEVIMKLIGVINVGVIR